MFGYSREEFLELEIPQVVPPENLELVFSKMALEEIAPYEVELLRKDGSRFWAELQAKSHLSYGENIRVAAMRDITDRKIGEDSRRESEAKYRALFEATNTGYLILDDRGRVLDANPEYVRLTGHATFEEIAGRSVVEWTAPHDQERNAAEVAKCMKVGFVDDLEIDYVARTAPSPPSTSTREWSRATRGPGSCRCAGTPRSGSR